MYFPVANLVNPSYPDFNQQKGRQNLQAQLRRLLDEQGVQGDIIPVMTPMPGLKIELYSGVF